MVVNGLALHTHFTSTSAPFLQHQKKIILIRHHADLAQVASGSHMA